MVVLIYLRMNPLHPQKERVGHVKPPYSTAAQKGQTGPKESLSHIFCSHIKLSFTLGKGGVR